MAELIIKTPVPESFSRKIIDVSFDGFSENGKFLFFKLTNADFQEILKVHIRDWKRLVKITNTAQAGKKFQKFLKKVLTKLISLV